MKKRTINLNKIAYSSSNFEIFKVAKLIYDDIQVGMNAYIYPNIYQSSLHNLDLDRISKEKPEYIAYRTTITKLLQNWLVLTFLGNLKKNNVISYKTVKHLRLDEKKIIQIPLKQQADICYFSLVKIIEQSFLNIPEFYNNNLPISVLDKGNTKFIFIEKLLEQLIGIAQGEFTNKKQTPLSSNLIKLLSSFLKINKENDANKYDYCKGKYKRINRFLVNKLGASFITIDAFYDIFISSSPEKELINLIVPPLPKNGFNFNFFIPLNKKSYKYYLKLYPLIKNPSLNTPFKKPEVKIKKSSTSRDCSYLICNSKKWLKFLNSKLSHEEKKCEYVYII